MMSVCMCSVDSLQSRSQGLENSFCFVLGEIFSSLCYNVIFCGITFRRICLASWLTHKADIFILFTQPKAVKAD